MNIISIIVGQGGCMDTPLLIGYAGENNIDAVDFDFSAWAETYGEGEIYLEIMRASDTAPYLAILTVDGSTARWTISDVDTARSGPGVAQLVYKPTGATKKSAIFKFYVGRSITEPGGDDPWGPIIERMEEIFAEVQQQASAADQSAQDAEAWAVGERGGEPVPVTDETHENNAKYYADEAGEIVRMFTETTAPAAVQAVNAAQTAAVAAVQTESTTQQAAIQQKGDDVLDELQAYADLPEDVADLKSDALKINDAITTQETWFPDNSDPRSVDYAIAADKTWVSSGDPKSYQFESAGIVSIEVFGRTDRSSYISLLKTVDTSLPPDPVSADTLNIEIEKNTSSVIEIPAACRYILVTRRRDTSTSFVPAKIVFTHYIDFKASEEALEYGTSWENIYDPNYLVDLPSPLTDTVNPFPIDIKISKVDNKYGHNINISDYVKTGANTATYYMSPDGDDSNDGLDEKTPLKTLAAALEKADVNTIILLHGTYENGVHFGATEINKEINLIGRGAVVLKSTSYQSSVLFTAACYVENIVFNGGKTGACRATLQTELLVFDRCAFINSWDNGLRALGGTYLMYQCIANNNRIDGFNYHGNEAYKPQVVEIQCSGFGNGVNAPDGENTNNASTAHENGTRVIRIGCRYSSCRGGVVADSNKAFSLNINVTAFSTLELENTGRTCSYQSGNGADMWLFDCDSFGSPFDLCAISGETNDSVIHTNRTYLHESTSGGSTITRVTVSTSDSVGDLADSLAVLQPAATASDVGKALIVKTINQQTGKPTSYEYGEAGGGDVTQEEFDELSGEVGDLKSAFDYLPFGVNDSLLLKNGVPVYTGHITKSNNYFSPAQTSAAFLIAEVPAEENTKYYFCFSNGYSNSPATNKRYTLYIVGKDSNDINTNTKLTTGEKFTTFVTSENTVKLLVYFRCEYDSIATGAYYSIFAYGFEIWKGNYEINNDFIEIKDSGARSQVTELNQKNNNDYPIELSLLSKNDLFIKQGFLNQRGQFNSNAGYKSTDFIRVKAGQEIKYNLMDMTTISCICFYSSMSESSFISYIPGGGSSYVSGVFTVPSDGYIRACCDITYFSSLAYLYTEITPNSYNFIKPIEKDLNVLLMGDSIFGNDGEIAGYLNSLCKSAINGAFGGTQVSIRPYTSDAFRFFDGVNIITALCEQDWTNQDAAAESLSSTYPWIISRLSSLKAVNMYNIDLLIMDWGTNDYTAGATIETITSAYNQVIDLLQETYPELRILITTPIWRYWGTESENQNGDTRIYNVSTLKEIALAIEDFMKNKRISVLNAYQNLPLSYKTANRYFDSGDTTHLNTFGNKVYAELLHGKIRSIY